MLLNEASLASGMFVASPCLLSALLANTSATHRVFEKADDTTSGAAAVASYASFGASLFRGKKIQRSLLESRKLSDE